METGTQKIARSLSKAIAAVVATASLMLAGCSAVNSVVNAVSPSSNTPTATVQVSITDAPSDRVLAASLTLNSIALTNSKGVTTSILSAPLTFEATHLDAVQEPLFSPAIPQDTYTSVTLSYANAVVVYVDPTTRQVVSTVATLANTSQTVTFATPVTVNNTTTSLLVDYLVANSVAISGTTVTVTPAFHVAAVPVPPQPTNGTNGLQCGVRGKVTAVSATGFTLTNPQGIALTVTVSATTQYQGLSGLSALAVGALVEVDIALQTNGTLLAVRVEEPVAPSPNMQVLVGPVTAVTGTPATSFTMMVRQKVGPAATANPVETDTITIDGSTKFLLPGRFGNLAGGPLPFASGFTAATMFAGQSVSVAVSGVTNNAATALAVGLNPQTVGGTIATISNPSSPAGFTSYTLTLASDNWLALLTGKTTVTVYTNVNVQAITSKALSVGDQARFNGFLFNNNGALVLLAGVEADGPGTPIGAPKI